MVKYFALMAVVVGSLVVANLAEARGHRGCSSCYAGGCPGGVCAVPVAPVKTAGVAPVGPVVASAPVAAATAPAPSYYASARRGLFGWRR